MLSTDKCMKWWSFPYLRDEATIDSTGIRHDAGESVFEPVQTQHDARNQRHLHHENTVELIRVIIATRFEFDLQ